MILEKNFDLKTRRKIRKRTLLLYKVLPVHCSLTTKMFYTISGTRTFGCTVCILLLTFFMKTILITVIEDRSYCLLFDFLFFLKAGCIKATSPNSIHTLKFHNTFERSALQQRGVLFVVWRGQTNTNVLEHLQWKVNFFKFPCAQNSRQSSRKTGSRNRLGAERDINVQRGHGRGGGRSRCREARGSTFVVQEEVGQSGTGTTESSGSDSFV